MSYKLCEQENRTAKHGAVLDDALVRTVSEAAFRIRRPEDFNLELTVRVGILTSLPGVGIGVASAVLALAEPGRYAIIDWRGWRQAFAEQRDSFSHKHYYAYKKTVHTAAGGCSGPLKSSIGAYGIWTTPPKER